MKVYFARYVKLGSLDVVVKKEIGSTKEEEDAKFEQRHIHYSGVLAAVRSGELTLGNPDDPNNQRHEEYIK